MVSYAYSPSTCRLTLEHCSELETNLGCATRLYLKTKQEEEEEKKSLYLPNYVVDGTRALLSGKAHT